MNAKLRRNFLSNNHVILRRIRNFAQALLNEKAWDKPFELPSHNVSAKIYSLQSPSGRYSISKGTISLRDVFLDAAMANV